MILTIYHHSGIKMKNGSREDHPDSNEQKVWSLKWFLDFLQYGQHIFPLMIKSCFLIEKIVTFF